jgi:DNA (cytosine-5)-methyltransferase 1
MLEDIVDEKYYISKKIEDVMYNANSKETASQQSVVVKEATKKGYAEAVEGDSINFERPNSKTRRGRVGKQVAQTLTTSPQLGTVTEDLKIRKLTPKECFRLMGFDDEDFEKAEKVNSNTQLYKQAGNSITVQVMEAIYKQLFECKALEVKNSKVS